MTIASDAIVSAIRGVILGELGEVRTVPAGAWIEGQPAQFGVHGGLDGDTARRLRASGQRLFDFEVGPPRRTGAVGSSAAAQAIHSLEVRIVLWLPITLVADTADAAHRRSVRAEMMAQARTITDALEWPDNLKFDDEGTLTGLVSGKLSEAATPRIVREDWSTGLFEVELRMTGLVHEVRAIVPAPAFASSPAIYVAGAADPEVGATLIADPGTVTGAHTERGQWLRDDAPIEGETGVTYVLVEADEGASITYRRTAIGSGGTVTSESNAIETLATYLPTDDPLNFIWLNPESVSGPVAAWVDEIGGAAAAQATDTKQPAASATAIGGAHPGVTSDGGDVLVAAFGPRIAGKTGITIVAAVRDGDTAVKVALELTTNVTVTNGALALVVNDGAAGRINALVRGTSSYTERYAVESLASVKVVSVGYAFDVEGADAIPFIRINGVAQALGTQVAGSKVGSAMNADVHLFGRSVTPALPWVGTFGHLVFRNSTAQDAGLDELERFVGARAGLSW